MPWLKPLQPAAQRHPKGLMLSAFAAIRPFFLRNAWHMMTVCCVYLTMTNGTTGHAVLGLEELFEDLVGSSNFQFVWICFAAVCLSALISSDVLLAAKCTTGVSSSRICIMWSAVFVLGLQPRWWSKLYASNAVGKTCLNFMWVEERHPLQDKERAVLLSSSVYIETSSYLQLI